MQSTFEAVVVPLEYNEQGVIHVSGTRVTLDSIMHAYDEGATPEEIVYRFPTLKLEDIYTVISYALRNPALIADYLSRQQTQRSATQADLSNRFPADNLGARLLARRSAAEKSGS